MTVTELPPAAPTASRGSPTSVLDHAVAVAAVGAAAADDERRLVPEVADALSRAGFSRHFVPRRWGGDEESFGELLTRAAAVGDACASAAWCAALYAAHGRFAAYLPYEGQRDLWDTSPDVRIAAGIMPATGTAVRVGAGWHLRGEWTCVSGVDRADWVLLAAVEQDADQRPAATGPGRRRGDENDPSGRSVESGTGRSPGSGEDQGERSVAFGSGRSRVGEGDPGDRPVVRVFAVPAADVRVRDSWHATGVRGTGSHTVVVSEVLVPDHRTFLMAELLAGTPREGRARCHAVPAMLGGGLIFAAAGLGAARHALAAWTRWAVRPAGPTGVAPLEADEAARTALGRSSAEIEAARLLLEAAAGRADGVDLADARATSEAVALNRRDAAVATDLLVGAVERLFRTGGVHAREDDGELQRCWRDLHTIAAHSVLRPGPAADAYAEVAAAALR
ncbi:acyl-CoA dehydrogenase family protein [Streptomyces olivochromogenes]|uniref:oxidoreductase n=1 Tax=Streptomyces olivochromogenes TaxID=1963 RepID=UPI0036D1530F